MINREEESNAQDKKMATNKTPDEFVKFVIILWASVILLVVTIWILHYRYPKQTKEFFH